MKSATIIAVIVLFCAIDLKADSAANENTIYDPSPNHLWNRLNETLFERTAPDGKQYGLNELDILYWARTTNLLTGVSHQRALAVLDEFINTHGEKLIQDSLKKALLQRDLWALFDWSARLNGDHKIERMELLKRLAIVIQRLEFTTNEIASLPDNYSLAEKNNLTGLPRGLFNTNGDWINISIRNGNVLGLVPAHDLSFGGRSVFMVLFHDADGRKVGLNYLKQLDAVEPMFVPSGNTNSPITLNRFPQFPTNSQWALVRRMRVIDTDGKIRTTHVVESIQLRTYLGFESKYVEVTNDYGSVMGHEIPPQRFNEFQMTRPSAEMISLGQKERDFIKIPFSMGFDPFEFSGFGGEKSLDIKTKQPIVPPIVLQTCIQCHSAPGIYSVNSFTRFLSLELPGAETTQMAESDGRSGEDTGLFSKELLAGWGLLQGLWMQTNSLRGF